MNTEVSQIGGIDVEIVRKKIKNLHIGCYPPEGRVRVAAPDGVSAEAIRIAVLTRMPWIRKKQAQFLKQERQSGAVIFRGNAVPVWAPSETRRPEMGKEGSPDFPVRQWSVASEGPHGQQHRRLTSMDGCLAEG